MIRKFLSSMLILFAVVIWANTAEAKPTTVEAWQEGTGANTVVYLKWTYTTGDKLYRTFNGDQWTEIAIDNPTAEKAVTVTDNNNGKGFSKGSNVYYEIRDAGYTAAYNASTGTAPGSKRNNPTVQATVKRVNMFIDSGNPTIEYAHGNYTSNTDTCRSCHVTHKAKTKAATTVSLLTQNSIRALCETCHSKGQEGSKYLVDYGAVRTGSGDYVPSPAGPITTGTEKETFGSPVPNTAEWAEKGLAPATSAHAFTGEHVSQGDTLNTGLSTDRKSTVTLDKRKMECTSCHSAHPSDNNYRLLKSVNNTYALANGATTLSATPVEVVVEAYAVSDGTKESVRYKSTGITQFCAQCHKAFHPGSGMAVIMKDGKATTLTTAEYNAGLASGTYTADQQIFLHPADKAMNLHGKLLTSDLPLYNANDLAEGDSPNNITLENGKTKSSYITCITCHYSHGTSSTGEQPSNFISGVNSTMLKRMDNQGVCQECHKQ